MEQTTIKETELNTPIDDRLARAKELGAINDKGEINEPLYAKRSQGKERFEKFANLDVNKPNALQENLHLRASMSQALTEAVGELPTAKYLVQKSEGAISNEIYRQLIDAVYSAEEEIPSGQGAEYFLMNGMTVNALDENKFIPDSRNDIDNYLYVDAIEIPGEIKQDELTIATGKYFPYFLSGKVDEVANIVKGQVDASITLKADYDRIGLIKTIFSNTFAKASTTASALTNHLVGTKGYIVDAVKEGLDFIFPMRSHNKQFAYGKKVGETGTAFAGYNSATERELVHIVNYQTYNNLIKYAKLLFNGTEFENFSKVNQFVVLPTSIFNPTVGVGAVEQLNVLVNSSGARVPGAILTIDKRGLKRIRNLTNTGTEFFPKNLTEVVGSNYRYTQGILKGTQVAVYNNPALEQDTYVPVESVS